MPTATDIEPREAIRAAAARNGSVELHFYDRGGAFCRIRVRMLDMAKDGRLVLDRPERSGQTVHIPHRQKLTGFVLMHGRRFRFTSRLHDGRILVSINDRQRVPGIVLDPPDQIEEQQRRRDYRVTLASDQVLTVELVAMDPAVPNACPVGARRYEARLIDISAGGMSLAGERRAFRTLVEECCCFATFHLPGSSRPLDLLLEVRHAVDVWESRQRRIGCAIVPWRSSHANADTRAILRFVTQEQRRQLAHRRT